MHVHTNCAAYGVNERDCLAWEMLSQTSLRLDSQGCKKLGMVSLVNEHGSYGARVAISSISKSGTTRNAEKPRENVVSCGALTYICILFISVMLFQPSVSETCHPKGVLRVCFHLE
jgi:hypothetical protein